MSTPACLLAPLLASLAATPAAAPPPARPALAPYVEAAMREWQVPGVAYAVVRDGMVVEARGLGVRRAGSVETVDADTLFPIASLSKGFAGALAALLVEEGKLGWDDRVADLLPGLAVDDPWIGRELRLRDLLVHRTGLPGTIDLLWLAGFEREEVLARLAHARPSPAGFRSGYSYLNVTYLVAGEALARRAGRPYDDLLRERILRPLGMSATRATLAEARGAANLASPHADDGPAPRPLEPESGDVVAPAAAIHSTAADMARWLLFHLGDGASGGVRLLREEHARELREPQNLIPRPAWVRRLYPTAHFQAYALGWVVEDYHGRTLVWNTGGLNGAACSIGFIPEERLGVVVLTNGPRTSFPEAIVHRALDAYLGVPARDWSRERREISLAARKRGEEARQAQEAARIPGTRPSLPLERYAGLYRQSLLGDVVVAAAAPEGLRVRWAGMSGRAEHWHHDTFRITWDREAWGTSLGTFVLDAAGGAARLELEEAGSYARAGDTP